MQATAAKPGTGPHIADADMWLLFDGSRTGHHHLFNNKLFIDTEQDDTPSLTKVLRLLRIEYLESSVAERRAYNRRGVASLKSNDTMSLVTARIVRLPQKQKNFFSGANLGSSLVDVHLAAQRETSALPRDEKKELYGKCPV